MAQLNAETKFTVFNLAHDENRFYVMTPMCLWKTMDSDIRVEAQMLNKTMDEFYEYVKTFGAVVELVTTYRMIYFNSKKEALKYCKAMNDTYLKTKTAEAAKKGMIQYGF